MAIDSLTPAKMSLAEGSASAVENTVAPRMRTVLGKAKKSTDLTTSPSTPSSQSLNNSLIRPTTNESQIASGEMSSSIDRLSPMVITSEDYFGPLWYTSGEIGHIIVWLIILAFIFALLGMFTMVSASMFAIVFVQFIKLRTNKNILNSKLTNAQRLEFFGSVYHHLYRFQRFLTVILFLVQFPLWYYSRSTSWYSIISIVLFLSGFVSIQWLYWPLNGYLLHKTICLFRPQNRNLLIESTERIVRERFTYNSRFLLIFAGSGGHTTEMLSLLRLQESFDNSMFRRYVVTKGDQRSYDDIEKYEAERSERLGKQVKGIYEIVWVARARYVRQSWLTTPFTALWCLFDCYHILMMSRPFTDSDREANQFPQTIICNGPGSSAIFVGVSHLMRMYGIIPVNRCAALFVESVARVNTLSLTGKIFYYLGLADAFITQHAPVAKAYYPDVVCEKMLVKRAYTGHDAEDKISAGV